MAAIFRFLIFKNANPFPFSAGGFKPGIRSISSHGVYLIFFFEITNYIISLFIRAALNSLPGYLNNILPIVINLLPK
jgi:hypothetical protein